MRYLSSSRGVSWTVAWPKIEKKPRVIWKPIFPSPWGLMLSIKLSTPFHPTPSFQTFHHPRKVFQLRQPLRSILCGLSRPCQCWAWFKGREAGILLQSTIYMIIWPFGVLCAQMPAWQLIFHYSLLWILHRYQADLLTSHPQQCVQSLHCRLSESNLDFIPNRGMPQQGKAPFSELL